MQAKTFFRDYESKERAWFSAKKLSILQTMRELHEEGAFTSIIIDSFRC